MAYYDYPEAGPDSISSEADLCQEVQPWDIVITTGVWIDDIDADYHEAVLKLAGMGAIILLFAGGFGVPAEPETSTEVSLACATR